MSDDIVARLRTLTDTLLLGDFQGLAATTTSAADEIERLRFERDGFREGNRQTLAALAEANEIAKRYKAERDEARRWCCELFPAVFFGHKSAEEQAAAQGWDCFKEER